MTEKSHPRSSLRFDAINFISYTRWAKIDQGMCTTVDISVTGCRVEVEQPFNITETVALSIGVKEDVLNVKGDIKHIEKIDDDKYHIGIKFVDISDNDRQVIENLIKD